MKIRITQYFAAPADRVFDAWLDPVMAGTWLFATASRPMAHVEIDARVGGRFRLRERAGDAGTEYRGKYVEIVPRRRLVFTLTVRNSPEVVTRVVAEIVPLGKGCELRLAHQNVPPDHASRIEGRWTGMLYGLAETLASASSRQPRDTAPGRRDLTSASRQSSPSGSDSTYRNAANRV